MDGLINDQLNSRLQELIESHVNNLRDDFQRLIGELPLQPPQETDAQQVADALACLKESVDSIHASRSQREMAERLLDAASRQASRVALFLVRDRVCHGYQCRGFETSGETFADLEMNPAPGDPLATSIAMRETIHLHGNSLAESVLAGWLEGVTPTQACLAPITVGDRAVGLVYADSGPDAENTLIHPEAVDILASVAGLFLERLRRASSPQPEDEPDESAPSPSDQVEDEPPSPEQHAGADLDDMPMPEPPDMSSEPAMAAEFQDTEQPTPEPAFEAAAPGYQPETDEAEPDLAPVPDFSEPLPDGEPEAAEAAAEPVPFAEPGVSEPEPEPFAQPEPEAAQAAPPETAATPEPAEDPFARTIPVSGWGADPMPLATDRPEPAEAPEPEPPQAEQVDEDARRFARLLVSEIVLYNEAQVKTGQKQGDLYERLKESILRSREAYQERFGVSTVQNFDDELIRTLALGDASLMGPGCHGA